MAAPLRALPPGVYFNPTAEECVRDYIKPWAAGVPLQTDRVICDVDVYSDSPGALLLGREPGFSRGFEHKWLLLSRCGGRGKTAAGRGKRVVATGGSWQSEQTPKGVVGTEDGEGDGEQPHGGRRRSFGFYVGKNGRKRGEKTPWLMEEFTALEEDGHGGGDGTFVVFCRIYLSPRLDKEDKEKKRQILGDDMVAFDRNGKLKPVRVVASPGLFDAVAQVQGTAPPPPRVLGFQQAQPARRVLEHQQGQPPTPSPPPRVLGFQQAQPAWRVLGHQQGLPPMPSPSPPPRVLGFQQAQPARRVLGRQQGQPPTPSPSPPPCVLGFQQAQPARRVLGHQQGQPPTPSPRFLGYQHGQQPAAPPLLRFLGHQHGQAAATPAVLGDQHGRAMLPWGVPAHHHGHAAAAAAPHQRFLGYRQCQAAVQGGPDEYCGTAVQPQLLHVLDPCYNQEASPSVRLVDPQQGEVMNHAEKKPRLSYGSPPRQSSDSGTSSSCLVHVSPCQEQGVMIQIHDDNQCCAEPVATTPPPQEIPGTATAGSAEAEPPCDVSAPAPAELADDAGKAGAEPMLDPGIYTNLVEFEPFTDAVSNFLVHGEFNPPYDDDDPPPEPGFDEFQLVEFGVVFDDLMK